MTGIRQAAGIGAVGERLVDLVADGDTAERNVSGVDALRERGGIGDDTGSVGDLLDGSAPVTLC